jgi:sec-independent protein translocase protein TatB
MTATVGLFIFDIGWSELVVIGVVALIAIGPKELPTVLRTLGQYMGKIKRMSAEFQSQFQDALREAELSDLKQHAQDIHSTVSDFTKYDPLANADKDTAPAVTQPETAAEPVHTETVVMQPVPTETAAAEPAASLPAIDVPLPEPLPAPHTEDLAPTVHPAQKQA